MSGALNLVPAFRRSPLAKARRSLCCGRGAHPHPPHQHRAFKPIHDAVLPMASRIVDNVRQEAWERRRPPSRRNRRPACRANPHFGSFRQLPAASIQAVVNVLPIPELRRLTTSPRTDRASRRRPAHPRCGGSAPRGWPDRALSIPRDRTRPCTVRRSP